METQDQGPENVLGRIESALYGSEEPPAQESAPDPEPMENAHIEGADAPEQAEVEPEGGDSPESEASAEPEEPTPVYQSVDELAEALELSPEDFANQTKVRVKVYGNEREVSLAELQAGYQKGEGFDQKKSELAQERAEFESKRQQQEERLNNELLAVGELTNAAEQQLLADYQSIDWNALAQQDAGQAALLKQQYQERHNQIQQVKADAVRKVQQSQGQAMQEAVQRESAALVKAIPEWRDEDVASSEKAEIAQMLRGYGYSDEELRMLVDHRQVVLLREMLNLRKAQERVSSPKEEKRSVAKRTNILKSGPRKSQSEKKHDRVDQLRSRLKKTGKMNDAAALLLERM